MSSILRKPRFASGLKLKENKKSEHSPIQILPPPKRVIIPSQMHTGAPCEFTVKRGDFVKTGQLIASSSSFISANIHSSITGTVKSILKTVNPATSMIIDAVEIIAEQAQQDQDTVQDLKAQTEQWVECNALMDEKLYKPKSTGRQDSYAREEGKAGNSFEYLSAEDLSENNNVLRFKEFSRKINDISPKELVRMVKDAGIVGLGGAAFPTHVKLSVPEGKVIDTVILNGCECEPYITADHRMMLEYGFEIIAGAYIIFKILNPQKVIIAIENNKEDAIEAMAKLVAELGLEKHFVVSALPSKYPMGAEKTLIKNLLKRKVPAGGLPLDVGAVVQNVATSRAIFDAVAYGKPLIERVITITGDIESPVNIMVRIGTLTGDLKEYFGSLSDKPHEVIFGGPMTGFSVANMSFPVLKGTGCVLVKEEKKQPENNCIRCARCVSVCPMNLIPLMYANYVKNNMWQECREYYIDSCIECGSCAYVCPASIPLVGYIKTGKAVIARK